MSTAHFIADKMSLLPVYKILQMFQLAKDMENAGEDIIHLEFGEPDFGTPQFILDAAYRAMRQGYTRYGSSLGMMELRKAIAEKLLRDHGMEVNPETEIIVVPGAKHAIYCSLAATLNAGEEVIITDPCFPPYEFAIHLVGGKPIRVPLRKELDYRLDPEELESHLSSKTKMVLLNFPNNPTGSILTRDALETVIDISQEHDLLVLSDEVYEKFVYSEEKSRSIASIPELRKRMILVNSFSKTYAMTGWRLGYAVATENIVKQLKKVQESTTTCVPPFCQVAGIEALKNGDEFVDKMVKEFKRRNGILVEGLSKIEGVSCRIPKGAFFAFPDFQNSGNDDVELSERFLSEARVVTVPGSSFGKCGKGHIRISYSNSIEKIEEALSRLQETVEHILEEKRETKAGSL